MTQYFEDLNEVQQALFSYIIWLRNKFIHIIAIRFATLFTFLGEKPID